MKLHEKCPYTTYAGMMMLKDMTNCMNEVAVIIDTETGTLLKVGNPDGINDYFNKAIKKYHDAGLSYCCEGWKCIVFDRYHYAFLDIDGICTLVNYMMNSLGPEKMNELLLMSETELKEKIEILQSIGF